MFQSVLKGSCLCGAVHYEVEGDASRFYHCHCKRCRKASGTGHASNLLMISASLRFIQGEELLKQYKVPEAKRFGKQFCSQCGSSLPRISGEADRVVIPAGSLDDEPPIKPQSRIFWDSRADWSCQDDMPRFAEYPA